MRLPQFLRVGRPRSLVMLSAAALTAICLNLILAVNIDRSQP